jgi:hypothetical protein
MWRAVSPHFSQVLIPARVQGCVCDCPCFVSITEGQIVCWGRAEEVLLRVGPGFFAWLRPP